MNIKRDSFLLMITFLWGCSYPGIFFTEHQHVGVQLRISPEETKPIDVNFGYDRGLFAMVPRLEKGKDAASVLAKSDFNITYRSHTIMRNVFASGRAANILTDNSDGTGQKKVEALFDPEACLQGSLHERIVAATNKLKEIYNTDPGGKGKIRKLYKAVFKKDPEPSATDKILYEELDTRLSDLCENRPDDIQILKLYEEI